MFEYKMETLKFLDKNKIAYLLRIEKFPRSKSNLEEYLDKIIDTSFRQHCLDNSTLIQVYEKQYIFCNELYIYIEKVLNNVIDDLTLPNHLEKYCSEIKIILDHLKIRGTSYKERLEYDS